MDGSEEDDFIDSIEEEREEDSVVPDAGNQVEAAGAKPKAEPTVTVKPNVQADKPVEGPDSEDTPKNPKEVANKKLAAFFEKNGVTLSPAEQGLVTEMVHTSNLMNGKSPRVMQKVSGKLQGVETILLAHPELDAHADEFCQIIEDVATNPDTVKYMRDNHFDVTRAKFAGSAQMKSDQEVVPEEMSQAVVPREASQEVGLSTEPQAKDSVIFAPKEEGAAQKVSAGDVVDPITQAIRDEILAKQQLLLQEEIAKGMEGEEKEDFLAQDLTAIRSYLQSDAGKQAVDDVMKNPELQKQMHGIERDGYKTVHTKFEESFRDVDWDKSADKVRITDVTDDNGKAVCTLKETTVDTDPQTVTLADGSQQTINNFRKIDFPRELETGNGPMHVSMAVRDVNGNNISEKEAVYFTAHYDDNGKLTEVSSPTPVHFSGDGPDAIGYIEVDGKAYTLPVTKGKYQEMMQEVAKNNGIEEAKDKVVMQDKEQEVLAIEDAPKEKPLSIEDTDKPKPLAIEDAPAKPLAIEDAPAKKPKQAAKPLAIEDAPKGEPKKQTEAQALAEKMKQSRAVRGNEVSAPESKGGGEVVNVKAKPEPKFKPLKLDDIESAELPDVGRQANLLDAAAKVADALSDLVKGVKDAAKPGINARTGERVSPAVQRLSAHTRENVDPAVARGAQSKGAGKARVMSTPNVAAPKPNGQSR